MKNNHLNHVKASGFKAPNGYFESIEDAVLSRLKADQFSKEISSSGFEVPSDYFESLDSKILRAVQNETGKKVVSLFTWKKAAYITGIAASLILAFNLAFPTSNEVGFDNLETASIENYLMNEDLNAYDIAPYLNMSDLTSDDFVETSLKASDLEEYLMQNSDVEHLLSDE